jgi:hypothetical protein
MKVAVRHVGVASWPMSEDENDPGANTQMFQAFVDRHPHDDKSSGSRWLWPVVAGVVALLIVVVLAIALLG